MEIEIKKFIQELEQLKVHPLTILDIYQHVLEENKDYETKFNDGKRMYFCINRKLRILELTDEAPEKLEYVLLHKAAQHLMH